MNPGSLASYFKDRSDPLEKTYELVRDVAGKTTGPLAAQIFGNGAKEYCDRYGATRKHVAETRGSHCCQKPQALCRQSLQPVPEQRYDRGRFERQTGHSFCEHSSPLATGCMLLNAHYL
jgi:hypothetical protein